MSTLFNVAVSAVSGAAAAGAVILVGSVSLQSGSPGIPDVGHSNITGNALAGRFGANTSPSLARVQVNETGSLQGVRSVTNDGVSVFGRSNAATGLGTGGYFTSSSNGGRAVIGDALSSTGATIGGLFYNRSSGSGAGVWGKAIGGGTGYGVFGETNSSSGFGMSAQNTATGFGLYGGTPDTSLLTYGALPKHTYGPGSAAAAMVPVAYGNVGPAGSVLAGSGNFTVSHAGTGQFDINVTDSTFQLANCVPLATVVESTGTQTASIATNPATGDFRVVTYDLVASALTDSEFTFVVYRAFGLAGPVAPDTLANPPAGRKFRGIEEWALKDPKGFEAWRKEYAEWERTHSQAKTGAPLSDRPERP